MVTVPGGHWTDHHNAMEQHQRSQVLRPDLRMDIPPIKVRAQSAKARRAPGQAAPAKAPAPVSLDYSSSQIAEIKVLGKGVKNFYKLGTTWNKAVDRRAVGGLQ